MGISPHISYIEGAGSPAKQKENIMTKFYSRDAFSELQQEKRTAMHKAFGNFAHKAGAINYTVLQQALLEYQDVTVNAKAEFHAGTIETTGRFYFI